MNAKSQKYSDATKKKMIFIHHPPRFFEKNYAKLSYFILVQIQFFLETLIQTPGVYDVFRKSCGYSSTVSDYCVDSNVEGALSLRQSHCGDARPKPVSWHRGAK